MDALKGRYTWHQCQCGRIFDADTPICPVYHKDGMPSPTEIFLTLEEVWKKRSRVWIKDWAPFESFS